MEEYKGACSHPEHCLPWFQRSTDAAGQRTLRSEAKTITGSFKHTVVVHHCLFLWLRSESLVRAGLQVFFFEQQVTRENDHSDVTTTAASVRSSLVATKPRSCSRSPLAQSSRLRPVLNETPLHHGEQSNASILAGGPTVLSPKSFSRSIRRSWTYRRVHNCYFAGHSGAGSHRCTASAAGFGPGCVSDTR
eukprot:SAG31_NODE_2355_length_5879_cov_6.732526_7_plen_191_part_00